MKKCLLVWILGYACVWSQHNVTVTCTLSAKDKKADVNQTIIFKNTTDVSLTEIYINDWNYAYNDKNSALSQRFSDEFVRSFHIAKLKDRGATTIEHFQIDGKELKWERLPKHPDIIKLTLDRPLPKDQFLEISAKYMLQFPNAKFTRYGYYDDGSLILKSVFLVPCQWANGAFVCHSNENLDDSSNAFVNYNIQLQLPPNYSLTTEGTTTQTDNGVTIISNNQNDITLYIEPNSTFKLYKNETTEVYTNIKASKVMPYQKAIIIDRITKYVNEKLGKSITNKWVVSQTEYERNPFNGIKNMPSFLTPFSDEFIFEIKFLKTYLTTYLKANTHLNYRNDNFLMDGLQMYVLMKYIERYHPDQKIMGNLSHYKVLKGYKFFNGNFNEQFYAMYLLMARKNLDQPIGNPKNTLIKFNEQIAGKYKAGLLFNMLSEYVSEPTFTKVVQQFIQQSQQNITSRQTFFTILSQNTTLPVQWALDYLIEQRDWVDYKIKQAKVYNDTVHLLLQNQTHVPVPIPLYAIRNDSIQYKQWLQPFRNDTLVTLPYHKNTRYVLNYQNEVPERNQLNNTQTPGKWFNKPFKFQFLKDFENPNYNQIFYVPEIGYNLYDGAILSIDFHNNSMYSKPLILSVSPAYATRTQSLIGSASTSYTQYYRSGWLHSIRYGLSANYYHYAPDAYYSKWTGSATVRFKNPDFRKNYTEFLLFRYININREPTTFTLNKQTQNYSVYNFRYFQSRSETLKHVSIGADSQWSNSFGKISLETQYRKLFPNNTQINLRLFAGTFLYHHTTSNFFDFGVSRPSDYLFDYNLLGRSETTGIFSQQYLMAEGAFKSFFQTQWVNQWMVSTNISCNIWNWIEAYADTGFIKNRTQNPQFLYSTGIRLNLVPDYFELYFPLYSSNGTEWNTPNYAEKIRFVVTVSPKTLLSLVTRKWF